MTALLREHLRGLPGPDDACRVAAASRAAQVLRPPGALSRLDEIAVWTAGWQRTPSPAVERPAALVFAGDHGVVAAGVSSYPSEVTAAMLAATEQGRATISVFAAAAGASVTAVDVGVGHPTADIRHAPALDDRRFDEIVGLAFDAVGALDTDLLVLGELGIGNTTAAAAVAAAVAGPEGDDVAAWVGRGAGLDDDALDAKRRAVAEAVARVRSSSVHDPIEVLRQVGGSELVAMAAAVVAARHRSLPVVLDGYICTAAAAALHAAEPTALDHCLVGHRSAEPGHRLLLELIDKRPVLDLDMRLGEGSGAMAAVPIVRLACAGVVHVATFDEWFGPTDDPTT